MDTNETPTCTAFHGDRRLAAGSPGDVFVAVKACLAAEPDAAILVFDNASGRTLDADLRGSDAEIRARFGGADETPRGPGRPRLGVVSREVTLLPRHWDWLAAQKGGASVALRRLVDEARRGQGGREEIRRAQEAADQFMSVLGGNLAGYEDAARALYSGDGTRFSEALAGWPADIRAHAERLAAPAFAAGSVEA